MNKVIDLFDVRYGVNLELNALKQTPYGINFVSRTAKNNGVSAKVALIEGVDAIQQAPLVWLGVVPSWKAFCKQNHIILAETFIISPQKSP